MARKNHLAIAFLGYSLLGLIIGALLGFLADAMFSAKSNARFEAGLTLYRIPTDGTPHAARDFISVALAREGFLDDFTTTHGIDAKTKTLLAHNLSVVARDASSSNAEMRLVGGNPSVLTTTLDELATFLTEALRSVENSDLQLVLGELDKAIEIANEANFELMSQRSKYGRLPSSAESEIQLATALVERINDIEFARRYTLKPQTSADGHGVQQRLDNIIKEQQDLAKRANGFSNIDFEHFKFARSLASAKATLRQLRQTKQRLVIEFNQGTPLRITGRAVAIRMEAYSRPTLLIVSICSLIGGFIGGLFCSLRRSRNATLTGLNIEKRLRVPVLGVIARSLTDLDERELRPIAQTDPKSISIAGVRSLNIALQLLMLERNEAGPVVFAELGDGRQARHVIANLAVLMAHSGLRVLVIETKGNDSLLSAMFERNNELAWTSSVDISDLKNVQESNVALEEGSVRFTKVNASAMPIPVPLADISHFDRVLVHAGDANKAIKILKAYGCGIGLVLCTAKARVSKLRKAIRNTLHGVVLCAYSIDETEYAGESRRPSSKRKTRTH